MKKSISTLVVFIVLTVANIISAQNYLNVNDPRNWGWGQGTIEEATISIKPCGVYMEYEMYLTFSARGTWFSDNDTLEVILNFELPEGSFITDSWLWFGEDILEGRILDRWTASSIYEEIVDRRQDPSILVKNSTNGYELRIFPMAGNETRKVKITYLAPARWTKERVYAQLPTNILDTSMYQLNKIGIITWEDALFGNPLIEEYPENNFVNALDTNENPCLKVEIPGDAVNNNLNFSVDAPLKNGMFVATTNYDNENYFQYALLPGAALELGEARKIAVMVNFVSSNSTIDDDDLLLQIKNLLHQNLYPADKFNLFFAKFNVVVESETWIDADSASIENTFANLGDNPISNYSNLPSVFAEAIDFLNNNEGGMLMLISNSDQEGDYTASNQLITDIREAMTDEYPVYIADIQDRYINYHQIGGRYYYGNEYFYSNLSRLTGGQYFKAHYDNTISETLTESFSSLSGYISYFDMYTKFAGGVSYGRSNLFNNAETIYLNSAACQIGKYQGDLPMTIDVSGLYNSELFFTSIDFELGDLNNMDEKTAKIWFGNYINTLEETQVTNDVIDDILSVSLRERILSRYSSFLCLDPAQDSLICWECIDENFNDNTTAVEDDPIEEKENVSELTLGSYPNPFNSQATIVINIPANVDVSKLSFKIYNILGQLVYTFDPIESASSGQIRLLWNGKNDAGNFVSSGTYIFVVTGMSKVQSLKLNYVK